MTVHQKALNHLLCELTETLIKEHYLVELGTDKRNRHYQSIIKILNKPSPNKNDYVLFNRTIIKYLKTLIESQDCTLAFQKILNDFMFKISKTIFIIIGGDKVKDVKWTGKKN